jgi:hypothetical protein
MKGILRFSLVDLVHRADPRSTAYCIPTSRSALKFFPLAPSPPASPPPCPAGRSVSCSLFTIPLFPNSRTFDMQASVVTGLRQYPDLARHLPATASAHRLIRGGFGYVSAFVPYTATNNRDLYDCNTGVITEDTRKMNIYWGRVGMSVPAGPTLLCRHRCPPRLEEDWLGYGCLI